jgi:uncharacterized protein (DUF2141 family)
MKRQIPLLTILLFMTLEATAMEWSEMTLKVEEIEIERGGELAVFVFLKQGFPIKHEMALKKYRFRVVHSEHNLTIEVPNIPFALKVQHDADGSGKVTKDWTGLIPAEGLGFSSGARLGFGPPSFKAARMMRPESGESRIAVIYP